MSFTLRIPEGLIDDKSQAERLMKKISDKFLQLGGLDSSKFLTKTFMSQLYLIPAGMAFDGNGANEYIAVHFKLPGFAAGTNAQKQQLITAVTEAIWSEMKGKIDHDRIFVNMMIKEVSSIAGRNYSQQMLMDMIAAGDK